MGSTKATLWFILSTVCMFMQIYSLENIFWKRSFSETNQKDGQEGYHNIQKRMACDLPLGMQDGRIQDEQITASSEWNSSTNRDHGPTRARLNQIGDGTTTVGAWLAAEQDEHQWIQVEFYMETIVTAIITQGRADLGRWVEQYRVNYTEDGSSWHCVYEGETCKIFDGNIDQNTAVTQQLPRPITVIAIRINPVAWHTSISLRFELLGCVPQEIRVIHECGYNGKLVFDACSEDERIRIISGAYGKRNATNTNCTRIDNVEGSQICSQIDATDRVRDICDGHTTCEIPVYQDKSLGDPCEGHINIVKCVRLTIVCQGVSRTVCGCEGERIGPSCNDNSDITVVEAIYRAQSDGRCATESSICPDIDVKPYFESECNGKDTCSITIDTADMGLGDLCTKPYLQVEYTCEDSPTTTSPQIVSLTRTQIVTSPLPTSRTESPRLTTLKPTGFIDTELDKLADVDVTSENVEEVASKLTMVLMENSEEIDDLHLQDISYILNDIVSVADPSIEVTKSVIQTVDAIVDSYIGDPDVSPAPNQIQRALEQQISIFQTENPGNASISLQNIAIQAVKIPSESLLSSRLAFKAVPQNNNSALDTTVTTRDKEEQVENNVEAAISFQLPSNVVGDIQENQTINVSFIVYNDASLFPSTILTNKASKDTTNVQRIVGGRVISATVEGVKVTQLPRDNPVETMFALSQVDDKIIERTNCTKCVFWNESDSNGLGDWSAEGCYYNRTLVDGRIVCHCTHLTSFAVLVDIHGLKSFALDILSKIGCGISISCLLITLITYISTRRLRRKQPQKILISLCVSLLCLYLVFVIGVEKGNSSSAGCITVSAMLHYFTLTSIAWMFVECCQMHMKFVAVVGRWSHVSKFFLKASLLAWGRHKCY